MVSQVKLQINIGLKIILLLLPVADNSVWDTTNQFIFYLGIKYTILPVLWHLLSWGY